MDGNLDENSAIPTLFTAMVIGGLAGPRRPHLPLVPAIQIFKKRERTPRDLIRRLHQASLAHVLRTWPNSNFRNRGRQAQRDRHGRVQDKAGINAFAEWTTRKLTSPCCGPSADIRPSSSSRETTSRNGSR